MAQNDKPLIEDGPFCVKNDGWGDVWIETASGRRIGGLDHRIDAEELSEALTLLFAGRAALTEQAPLVEGDSQ